MKEAARCHCCWFGGTGVTGVIIQPASCSGGGRAIISAAKIARRLRAMSGTYIAPARASNGMATIQKRRLVIVNTR